MKITRLIIFSLFVSIFSVQDVSPLGISVGQKEASEQDVFSLGIKEASDIINNSHLPFGLLQRLTGDLYDQLNKKLIDANSAPQVLKYLITRMKDIRTEYKNNTDAAKKLDGAIEKANKRLKEYEKK